MRDHVAFALLEAAHALAPVVALRRKSIAQHAVDALPGGEDLRADELGRDRPRASRVLRGRVSAPRSGGSIPSRRSLSIRSGCATMPAPRPASSLSTRSK